MQIDLTLMQKRKYEYLLARLLLLIPDNIQYLVRFLRHDRHLVLYPLAKGQLENIIIVIKDFIFIVVSCVVLLLEQVISDLDAVVVIVKVTIDESIQRCFQPTRQFFIRNSALIHDHVFAEIDNSYSLAQFLLLWIDFHEHQHILLVIKTICFYIVGSLFFIILRFEFTAAEFNLDLHEGEQVSF